MVGDAAVPLPFDGALVGVVVAGAAIGELVPVLVQPAPKSARLVTRDNVKDARERRFIYLYDAAARKNQQ